MPLENVTGYPVGQIIPSAALGASTGRVIPIGNLTWCVLDYFSLTYTATATVGSRAPAVDFKDSAGNLLFRWFQPGATVTASGSAKLQGGAGLPTAGGAAATFIQGPLPVPMLLPPGATMTVVDTANIDVNDTVSGGFTFAQ